MLHIMKHLTIIILKLSSLLSFVEPIYCRLTIKLLVYLREKSLRSIYGTIKTTVNGELGTITNYMRYMRVWIL
jgi:hypothetical protein